MCLDNQPRKEDFEESKDGKAGAQGVEYENCAFVRLCSKRKELAKLKVVMVNKRDV